MAEQNGGEEESKPHEPTEKKRRQAREKGDVPRAPELSVALSYAGFLLGFWAFGESAVLRLGDMSVSLLTPARRDEGGSGSAIGDLPLGAILSEVTLSIGPILLVPAILVILGSLAEGSLVFASSRITPKLSKISPISNAKQKYGIRGLFEFVKSTAKLLLVSAVLAGFAVTLFDPVVESAALDPRLVGGEMLRMSWQFMVAMTLIAAALGVLDAAFQRADWLRRNRMSQRELKEETKESEGDPQVKAQRRQRAQALIGPPVAQAVRDAAVVVVNPEHYAVALDWHRGAGGAPTCVAKGVDEVALRIREIAEAHSVPIHADPPTARALYATLNVGDEVQPDLYQPVAAAIRFAEALRARRRALGV